MTESCHFNDKNSLGGSFCIWKGGSIMATTRIIPLHIGKGRTESRAISDIWLDMTVPFYIRRWVLFLANTRRSWA